ncbi:MAG TPA: hypothetical protein VMU78_08120 [Methylocella sp.]|nr:hypothetical protein [Methylocella sp.]
MKLFSANALWGALLASLCCGAAMAADLSTVKQWVSQYPSEKILDGKPLWDQPGVQAAMRAAMGDRVFALAQKATHSPEAPVASDGKGDFAAWSCVEADDCAGNNMTVFFDSAAGNAQVCWRSSDGAGGKVQDLWLANGGERPLPINGCGVGERDPFASLKRYGDAK